MQSIRILDYVRTNENDIRYTFQNLFPLGHIREIEYINDPYMIDSTTSIAIIWFYLPISEGANLDAKYRLFNGFESNGYYDFCPETITGFCKQGKFKYRILPGKEIPMDKFQYNEKVMPIIDNYKCEDNVDLFYLSDDDDNEKIEDDDDDIFSMLNTANVDIKLDFITDTTSTSHTQKYYFDKFSTLTDNYIKLDSKINSMNNSIEILQVSENYTNQHINYLYQTLSDSKNTIDSLNHSLIMKNEEISALREESIAMKHQIETMELLWENTVAHMRHMFDVNSLDTTNIS